MAQDDKDAEKRDAVLRRMLATPKQSVPIAAQGVNEIRPNIREAAEAVAIRAGAIIVCPECGKARVDAEDPRRNKRAFEIGALIWKEGNLDCTKKAFMDTISDVMEMLPRECPNCGAR